MQLAAESADIFRGAHRVLDLTKNLRLADDHRIKSAGNPEGMTHGSRLVMHVEIGRQFLVRHLVVGRQPVDHLLRRFRGTVDLGPVAGRQDRHLLHRLGLRQFGQRMLQLVGAKSHAFADGERCRVVVDA
ncbi:hypothetical protein SDC9_168692 [bioreactor metagenome]|uniref:Uncharacterized protein n=1 Tax=bioreactor metagenome TaxID=1076179 RepID=A0A645GBQ8_9ZZZZ